MDADTDNGLILCDQLIPEMLLCDLMCLYFDVDTLNECHLVCKRWSALLEDYVWRRKAQLRAGTNQLGHESIAWSNYRQIVVKNLFNRNLIQNHSGEHGLEHSWTGVYNGGHGWEIECPPVGMPLLPIEDGFDGQRCFVTSFGMCSKYYTLNLVEEGFAPDILDHLQPPIEISEWYGSRFDCGGEYYIRVELLNEMNEIIAADTFMDRMLGAQMNTWLKYKYTFRNYGKGLRRIQILHMGRDTQFWAGFYGTKMARTSLKVLPLGVDNGPDIPVERCADDLRDSAYAIELFLSRQRN